MLVKDFAERIAEYAREVGCDGKGAIGAHKLPSRISVECLDPEDDNSYEFVGIEPSMLPGCGCWDGIRIVFRKRHDAASHESKEQK